MAAGSVIFGPNKLRLMTRLQKNVSVFQGGQMTPLALACGRPCTVGRFTHTVRMQPVFTNTVRNLHCGADTFNW